MIRASFSVVKNKLADSKCGCGSSFSVLATTNSSPLLHGRLRHAWVTDLQLPVSSSSGHTHFFQYLLHSNRGCKSIIASNPWHYLRFCVPQILVVLQACDTEGNPQQLRVERKYGCCSPFGLMMFDVRCHVMTMKNTCVPPDSCFFGVLCHVARHKSEIAWFRNPLSERGVASFWAEQREYSPAEIVVENSADSSMNHHQFTNIIIPVFRFDIVVIILIEHCLTHMIAIAVMIVLIII